MVNLNKIYSINEHAKILILGRNNHDIEDYVDGEFIKCKYDSKNEKKYILSQEFPTLCIEFSTVHGSKGLEEEYVIVLNCNDERLGFPNKVEDDELLKLVLTEKSHFKYAEERRLWYVALTRTKNIVYLIVNCDRPSVFVEEIKEKCFIINPEILNDQSDIIECPHCKTGKLILRIGEKSNKEFYGCSNFPYCTYKNFNLEAVNQNHKRCPRCNDFMIYVNNKFKCSNTKCKFECDLETFDEYNAKLPF